MAGRVQGGLLGRWFEELCRLKHGKLKEVASASYKSLAPSKLPARGGVYTFWWTGDSKLLNSSDCNRKISLVGPGGKRVSIQIDEEWLGISAGLPIPLYVGKTASNLNKRVGQHLMLGSERILPLGGGSKKARPPTTSCQLRAGVEHLFPGKKDTRMLILENLGLSYVELHGDIHAANRFYLEDMSIGLMRPPLNIDIER